MNIDLSMLPEMVPLKQFPEVQIHKALLINVYKRLQDLMDSGQVSHLLAFHELASATHDSDHVVAYSQSDPQDPIHILMAAELIDGVTADGKLSISQDIKWIVAAGTYPSNDSYNLRSIHEVVDIPDGA